MTTLAVIQARMGSTRFPGKVLADVGGEPLLGIMLGRLRGLPVTTLVVATSHSELDDPIESFCAEVGVPAVRGSEHDVLARFGRALDLYPADTVVRLTADCPLADPAVIADAIELHGRSGADYTSNTLIRTYPDGLDVEVVSAEALRVANTEATHPIEREHVTPFVYRRPERFKLTALRNELLSGAERWTVDTTDDLELVHEAVRRLPGWHTAGWQEILATVGRRSQREPGELILRPAVSADRKRLLDWRNDPVTVRNSRSGSRVTEVNHRDWFARRLVDPGGRIWMASVDDHPVGQVRVDVRCGVGEIAFSVDSSRRGRGHGSEILRQLVDTLAADYQVRLLRAIVHCSNGPSKSAFAVTGFSIVGQDGDFIILERARDEPCGRPASQ